MKIYCCNCSKDVDARLTSGKEIYPHRSDLGDLPFWICDCCKQFVGCHHKTTEKTNPLGVIPSPEIKEKRKVIHELLDPIWRQDRIRRNDVYKMMKIKTGKVYHTAEIRTLDEANKVIGFIKDIRRSVGMITI